MSTAADFAACPTTAYAEGLDRSGFCDHAIRCLWAGAPRVAGPAYTVQLEPGDNLMLHAAVHEAPSGAIIAVDAGSPDFAVAGGNVCAIAQRRGIAALVIDGVIRDLAEVRTARFPVYARGVVPVPGAKRMVGPKAPPIRCGGAAIATGDLIVADEDGIVVIPQARADELLALARVRVAKDAAVDLEGWIAQHRQRIAHALDS